LYERSDVLLAFDTLGLEEAYTFTNYFWLMVTYTAIVNLAAILIHIPAVCCREFCFSETHGCIHVLCQLCMGKFALGIVFVLVLTAFFVHFTVTCVLLPATSVLTLVIGACAAGHEVVHGVAQALSLGHWISSLNAVQKVENFCHIGMTSLAAVTVTGTGCILCVVGQVFLLIATTNTYVRITMQPKLSHEAQLEEENQALKSKYQQRYGAP
jgi:hypothetical protein